jgi:ankyrin repeat protein
MTPLLLAARYGHAAVARLLLEKKADVKYKGLDVLAMLQNRYITAVVIALNCYSQKSLMN